ncbi:hypothetical protein [Fundidesulfovibrio soli]|uniref:hypothetical protein n=1 Tax=Fundidesulfovibrio soli TaxID=2922716 RepID=UPI001FAFFDB1|nr:hypothetical protein [Fundidesulfovibrio soli]
MMKILWYVAPLVLMALFNTTSFAQTVPNEECKRFTVVFEDKVTAVPSGVYAGEKRIGTTQPAGQGNDGSQKIAICIDRKYAGAIDKHTILYLSGDKLMIYNVWSAGVDLREGDDLKGFPNRNSVYMHEARVLFHALMDYVLSFVRELLGKLLGETVVQNKTL